MKLLLILVTAAGFLFFTGCDKEDQAVSEQKVITEAPKEEAVKPVAEPEAEVMITEEFVAPTPEPELAPVPEQPAAAPKQAPPLPAEPMPAPGETDRPHEPNEVYVIVNGEEITYGDIMERVNRMTGGRPLPPQVVDRVQKQAAEQAVTEKLLNDQVEKQNIQISPDQAQAKLNELVAAQGMTEEDLIAILEQQGVTKEQVLADILKGMRYEKLLESQFGDINIPEQEVREYYDQNITQYQQPEKVRASHILIDPKKFPSDDPNNAPEVQARALAEQIKKQLDEGADFGEMAKQHSADTGSAANGGDLNFFARGQMVKPFEDVAFSIEPGQISDIVETRFGYHIIKVTDKTPASTSSFEEVKDVVKQQLQMRQKGDAAQKYIDELKKQADIVYSDPNNAPQPQPEPGTEMMPMP